MSNIYCAPSDITDILSQPGVTLRTDDAPPSAYGNAAVKAGNKIDWFCFRRYDPAQLALSSLVTDWAAVIAAYYLCVRRGNPCPEGIDALYQDAIAELTEVKKALNDIPGIGVRRTYAPTISKMRPTMRPYPRAVVEVSQGTHLGGESINAFMHKDAWDTWGINNYLTQVF